MVDSTKKSAEIAPNRAERKACWDSRDAYWKCIEKNGTDAPVCDQLRTEYLNLCPGQWVKHFDRKFIYEQYKKKVEQDGFEPITENAAPKTDTTGGGSKI
ncbi:hypothetical protein BV898_12021 [Hypsibius exemplaris]|uniref:Cytochrome c oxidase assembly factor 6-like protein n=1 Tax=Hypsibius exemplaris TaxID=2072580 RepID=A0A1W0WF44_HYPEX|nr:hypothetical protein BV898_12021 [Hypsibius exemplaris]